MAWVLVASGLAYVGAAAVTGADRKTPANFSGYASGTALHVGAIQAAAVGPRLVDTDVAPSGASVNTAGLPATLDNEMGEPVQPKASEVANKKASGLGTGLQLGLGNSLPNDPNADALILSGLAHATAPPDMPFKVSDCSAGPTCTDIGPIKADPLVYAGVLHGEAEANIQNLLNRCPAPPPASTPFGRGQGFAADAQLVDTGTANATTGQFQPPLLATDTPGQNVVQSDSKTYPINNGDGTFGLVSEVHVLLAPIRLANSLTIEVGGDWVLRATATGKPGGSKIEYFPSNPPVAGQPVIRILQGVTDLLTVTLQQLLGSTGLSLPVPGLLNLTVGTPPHAIGGTDTSATTASANGNDAGGTKAAAALDVIKIQLVPGATNLADVRVGHMEVFAQVPAGGFSFNDCGNLKVTKVAGPNVTGPFNFAVSCPGVTLDPTEAAFTLAAGASKTIPVPTDTHCTVTETGKGNATSTAITESPPGSTALGTDVNDGKVIIPAGGGTVGVTFVNTVEGGLQVVKTAGQGLAGPFQFSGACVDGAGAPVTTSVPATFTLQANSSTTFDKIPGGTVCTIKETDNGGAAFTKIADTTAPTTDGIVTITGGATQVVTFSNEGAPLVVGKILTGASAGKGPFKFHVACVAPGGGAFTLPAADTDFNLAGGDIHPVNVEIPDGSTCTVTETDNGGATATAIEDTTAPTADGIVTIKDLTTQAVAFTNAFVPPIKLVVTKKVSGNIAGPFNFTVTCTNGTTPVTLAAGDAAFSLSNNGSKSIAGIPNGSLCTVKETSTGQFSTQYVENSGTNNDGVVTIPVDGSVPVEVDNLEVSPCNPGDPSCTPNPPVIPPHFPG
jgi:uncharacterized protein DUF5979